MSKQIKDNLLPFDTTQQSTVDVLYLTAGLAAESDPIATAISLTHQALSLTEQGLTVIVPTFSFDFCDTGMFSVKHSNSYCGLFSEQWRSHPLVARTWKNPIHSVAVAGPLTSEILELASMSTFGKGSAFDWMSLKNTLVCLWGVWPDDGIAFIHLIEERLKVPYRQRKTFHGTVEVNGFSQAFSIDRFIRCGNLPSLIEHLGSDFCRSEFVSTQFVSNSIVTTFRLSDFIEFATAQLYAFIYQG